MPEEPNTDRIVPMRLQKFLARAGVASRRGSEDLMTAGRVAINGETITALGAKVDPLTDTVTVDGKEVTLGEGNIYLALNKPTGVVTTMSDPQGRPTVATLVPLASHPGLFPVGRLDADTTGLLLFTTDGEMSHRLLHPRWKVPKTYTALVDGTPDAEDLTRLSNGIQLDDGMTAPAKVQVLFSEGAQSHARITITEGRKRQVRRMFSALSHPVVELHRDSFGPIQLADLPEGQWRYLDDSEVAALKSAAGMGGD